MPDTEVDWPAAISPCLNSDRDVRPLGIISSQAAVRSANTGVVGEASLAGCITPGRPVQRSFNGSSQLRELRGGSAFGSGTANRPTSLRFMSICTNTMPGTSWVGCPSRVAARENETDPRIDPGRTRTLAIPVSDWGRPSGRQMNLLVGPAPSRTGVLQVGSIIRKAASKSAADRCTQFAISSGVSSRFARPARHLPVRLELIAEPRHQQQAAEGDREQARRPVAAACPRSRASDQLRRRHLARASRRQRVASGQPASTSYAERPILRRRLKTSQDDAFNRSVKARDMRTWLRRRRVAARILIGPLAREQFIEQ